MMRKTGGLSEILHQTREAFANQAPSTPHQKRLDWQRGDQVLILHLSTGEPVEPVTINARQVTYLVPLGARRTRIHLCGRAGRLDVEMTYDEVTDLLRAALASPY